MNARTRTSSRTVLYVASGLASGLAACALAVVGLSNAYAQNQSATGSAEVHKQRAADQNAAGQNKEQDINGLIDHLHGTLKITPQQEPLWQDVARVMRENAQTLTNIAKARSEQKQTANAMDDLKSYAQLSDAHASGARRLVSVFQPLYDNMSPEQKRAADAEFRDHFHAHNHHAG